MPTRPPSLRPAKPRAPWSSTPRARGTRQQRGYGRKHDAMRAQVLREEPLCRACADLGRITATEVADHIVPKAEGGTDERSNYQGLCGRCHKGKTGEESRRGVRRHRRG